SHCANDAASAFDGPDSAARPATNAHSPRSAAHAAAVIHRSRRDDVGESNGPPAPMVAVAIRATAVARGRGGCSLAAMSNGPERFTFRGFDLRLANGFAA